jgi:hypothetical protein
VNEPPVEALIQVGAQKTRYLRGGTGPTLLLLLDPSAGAVAGSPLFAMLARHFRVIAPLSVPTPADPPPALGAHIDEDATAGADRWLIGLLEGLGLDRPVVVAGHDLARFVLNFRVRHGGRIGTAVVLSDPLPDDAPPELAPLLSNLASASSPPR